MTSRTLVYPDYGASYSALTGVFTRLEWRNSQFVIDRSDSVKRKKPVGAVALFNLGTGVYTTGFNRQDLIYRTSFKNGSWSDYSFVAEHGSLGGSFSPSATTNFTAYNRMIVDARATSVNIGQLLAEYRQTAKLFPSLAARVVAFAVELRRVRRRALSPFWQSVNDVNRRRWDSQLASDWLQFQYGVKPLAGDMVVALERLKTGLKAKPLVSFCKGSATEKKQSTLVEGTLRGTSAGNSWFKVEETATSKVSYKGMYVVKNENVNAMAGSLGFTNPLALAWELVPFSFVIDWWINVGEVLQSLDNPLYFENLRYIRSVKTQYRRDAISSHGKGFYEWFENGRSAPSGSNGLIMPRWKPDPSTIHIANGLALLRGISKWK